MVNLMKNYSDTGLEAGCDEVGRGCLCGPVVAAAVILDSSFGDSLVNDSKKLNSKVRQELDSYIKEHAVAYAMKLAPQMSKEQSIIVSLSGRGDKDVNQVRELLKGDNL